MEGSTCYNCAAQAHAGAHFDCSVLLTVCFLRRSQDEDVWVQRAQPLVALHADGCIGLLAAVLSTVLHWPARSVTCHILHQSNSQWSVPAKMAA
jgi:hypothetical protein